MAREKRGIYTVALVFGTLALGGCSDGEDAGAPAPTAGEFPVPPAGAGLQLSLERSVPSGGEAVFCKHYVMPESVEITKLEHITAAGSHHVLGYRTALSAEEATDEIFDCGDVPGQLVYASQFPREATEYPAGVGMKFGKGEVIRLEVHFVNVTGDAQEALARVNFWSAPSGIDEEAGSFFLYDRDVAIPPMSKHTAKMHCEIPEAIEIVYALPHTHKRGTGFRAYVVGADGKREQFVDSTGYGNLDTVRFEERVLVAAGEAIELECDYFNETADWVVQGPSGPGNEMCLLLGSYFPRLPLEAELCTMVGSGTVHEGTKTCGEALGCAQSAPPEDDAAQPKCFSDVCPGSSDAANGVGACVFMNCPECILDEETCTLCILQNCTEQMAACQAATCGE